MANPISDLPDFRRITGLGRPRGDRMQSLIDLPPASFERLEFNTRGAMEGFRSQISNARPRGLFDVRIYTRVEKHDDGTCTLYVIRPEENES